MTTKTLASSLAVLAMFAAQGAVEPVWNSSLKDTTTINAVGFENFALGATPATSYDDSGSADSSKAYFLYSGASGDDQSVVTNHDNFAFNKIPNYFSTLDNSKYLSLSTEGGTLFRSINVISTSGDTPALGQAEPITATGLFVDTLVQFTPCEEPPAFNDADQNKLAVWLGTETNATGDVVGTNLCVRAGYLTYEDGAYGRTSATYTLASASAISVQAGEWVRLTVKAIDNVYTASGLSAQPGFQVYINDELAEFAEAVGSADFLTQLETIDATAKTALDAKTILPSMQAAAELTAVGFQGTGAVDDFVVTTDKPGFLAVDFTLFWDTNIVALETTLNPAPGVSPETTSGAALTKVFASLKNGDVVQVSTALAPTDPEYYEGVTEVASGYEIDWVNTVLTNVTMAAVGGAEDPTGYNFTAVGDGPYSVTLVTKSTGGGDLTPVNPDGAVVAVQAATAEAALAKVELKITDTAAATAGQASVVKLVATAGETEGTWNVSVAIDEEAEAFVDPDEAVAVVAGVLSGSATSVEVAADKLTPGLYYSLAVSTEVDGTYNEGTRYLATGGENGKITLPITKPEGTKAFYKVLVNMTNPPPANN